MTLSEDVTRYVNTSFKVPYIYVLTHVLAGYLGYYNNGILVFFLIYQLYQYTLNIRFFLLTKNERNNKNYEEGNSFQHTLKKIAQALAGFILAYIVDKML